jgi:DHA2 family multidrug resistance protein
VTAVALVVLVVCEYRVGEPIINLRLLRNLPLSVGSGMGLVFGITLFGTTFLLPELLQQVLGYPAFETGLVLLPRAISLLILMPVVGWLYNRVDPRVLIGFGAIIIYAAYNQLAHLSTSIGAWNLIPLLLLMGAGMPFMFVTVSTVALSTVPKRDMTSASSLYTLTRRIGGNIGYALLATVIARREQFHRARLVANLNPYNSAYKEFRSAAASLLRHAGVPAAMAPTTATALAEKMMSRQSLMMAYNDASWILGLLFLTAFPLLFLLPGRKKIQEAAANAAKQI